MRDAPRFDGRDVVFLTALLAVGSLLLFARLGDRALWQDEAETALLARSVLEFGVPTAWDGRNLISQEAGAEFTAPDYRWFWTPWLQHYLAAASFALFGETTWAARLPFALLGLGCLYLTYLLAFRLARDRRAARIAALILLSSVPFLLHMRQCRYYAGASFFSLLFLYQYLQVLAARPRAHWWMALSIIGLFHSHYVLAGALCSSAALHFAATESVSASGRARLRPLAIGALAGAVFCLPWVPLFARNAGALAAPGLDHGLRALVLAADQLNRYAFPLPLALAAVCFWLPRASGTARPSTRELWLLPTALLTSTLILAFAMPYFFFRYYAALIPIGAALQGVLLARAWAWRAGIGALLVLLLLFTDLVPRILPRHRFPNRKILYLKTGDESPAEVVGAWSRFTPLAAYVYEITHPVDGPIEAVARYLNEHGRPTDTVIATYGDLPLQFYTPMRVIGASSPDPERHLAAEWIWIRAHAHRAQDQQLQHFLRRHVDWTRYQAISLDVLDVPFENRPAPEYHKFRTVRAGAPRVRIFRRTESEPPTTMSENG